MSEITLRQLEIFALVVEHGSFRRCAEHVGISQASISEHVRELETGLGVRLFDRYAGSPATLTTQGLRAHRRATAILGGVNDLLWDTSGGRTGTERRVAVAMHPFLMRYLGEAVVEFRSRHPETDVKLDLVPEASEVLAHKVEGRELDMAYVFVFDGQDIPDSEFVRLEPLGIFVAHNHRLAREVEPVTLADIRATPSILLTQRNALRGPVDRALQHVGGNGSPIALETDEYGLILTSIAQGLGFGCLFQELEQELASSMGIVRVRLEHEIPSLQIRRITRYSAGYEPLTRELIEQLTKTLKGTRDPPSQA
jgi:DNA-binding transcriptional LysR family regulator